MLKRSFPGYKIVLVLLLMVLTLTLTNVTATATTRLRLAQPSAATHPNQVGAELLKDLVYEATDGEVIIDIFAGGVLGGERDQNEGIQIGLIDMGMTTTGVLAIFAPEMNIFNIPFLFRSPEHFLEVTTGPIGDELLAGLERHGYKGLYIYAPAFRVPFNSVRPINTPEDFSRLNLRTMEVPAHMDAYQSLGASVTPIAWGELYTALQLGTVDGAENALSSIYSQAFYEVTKYVSLVPVVSNACVLIMNLDKWNSLPENHRMAIEDALEASRDALNEAYLQEEQEAKERMIELGISVNEPDDVSLFVEAVDSVINKYKNQLPAHMQHLVQEILDL